MSEEIRIPVYIANPTPFRLAKWDEFDEWSPTIQDINQNTYNYVKLHRISRYFDIGLPCGSPLAVGFDGSFIIPGGGEIKTLECALGHFNRVFASLLLGGLFISSVDPEDISLGALFRIGYFRHEQTFGGNGVFHQRIGDRSCGQGEAIELIAPPMIQACEIEAAYSSGTHVFSNIPNLSPSLLASAITDFTKRKFREALIHSWVCVEQILSTIWEDEFLVKTVPKCNAEKRSEFLESNQWSAAHKAEMLFQTGTITAKTLTSISKARRSRNNLAHSGKDPQRLDAVASIKALSDLIDYRIKAFNLPVKKSTLSDFAKGSGVKVLSVEPASNVDWNKVQYWKAVPSIPGEKGWSGDFETKKEITVTPYTKLGPVEC